MFKNIFIGLFLVALGAALGAGVLFGLSYVLRFDHPVLSVLGVRKPEIIGFLPYWLLNKTDKEYEAYITTLTYFGLAVDTDGKPVYLAKPGEEEPGWTALKGNKWQEQAQKAPGTKKSLLVHSADDDVIYSLLASPEEKAKALVSEVGPLMERRKFTDLNIDIESFSEATVGARMQFTRFVQTIVTEVKKYDVDTVTVEIPPIALFKMNIADPIELGRVADRIVLMTYDYHYSGSFLAGPVAPVGGAGSEREFDVTMAVKEAVRQIPKEKVILGIPLYGYEWETVGSTPGAATIPGSAQTASSRRIAQLLSDCATCSAQIDPVSREPSIVYDDGGHFQQLFYENAASMNEKITVAQEFGLGGVALWALGYEDGSILTPLGEYKNTFIW